MKYLLIALLNLVAIGCIHIVKNRDRSNDGQEPSRQERGSHGPIGKWDRVYPQKEWHA